MKTTIVTLLTVCLLTACATPARYAWKKTGVDTEGTRTALAECRYQVKLNKVEAHERLSVIEDCMVSKGFRWVQVN